MILDASRVVVFGQFVEILVTAACSSMVPLDGGMVVIKKKCGTLQIEGFSRAGIETYFRVPEFSLLLDIGRCPREFIGTSRLFLSHFHIDHAAGLPYYVGQRWLFQMPPPQVMLPAEAIDPVRQILESWEALHNSTTRCELIPLNSGDTVDIGNGRRLRAFATHHRTTSIGCTIIEQRRKLKPEFVGLASEDVREHVLAGEEVVEVSDHPWLSYVGDSGPETLDATPELFNSEILILETSFFTPGDIPRARFGAHLHVEDVAARAELFRNSCLVLNHISERHSEREVWGRLRELLPQDLCERIVVWL